MTKAASLAIALLILATCNVVFAQSTNDPFPNPIPTTDRVITVKFADFATIPDFNGAPARPSAGCAAR